MNLWNQLSSFPYTFNGGLKVLWIRLTKPMHTIVILWKGICVQQSLEWATTLKCYKVMLLLIHVLNPVSGLANLYLQKRTLSSFIKWSNGKLLYVINMVRPFSHQIQHSPPSCFASSTIVGYFPFFHTCNKIENKYTRNKIQLTYSDSYAEQNMLLRGREHNFNGSVWNT